MNKRKRIAQWCAALILSAALLGAFLWWQNYGLMTVKTIVRADVSEGMRIMQLSDLHGTWFGRGQAWLRRAAEQIQPDAIMLTGDILDKRRDNEAAMALIPALAEVAPVYYVTGNHEYIDKAAGNGDFERLLDVIEETEQAFYLKGETVFLTEEISLTGAEDVAFKQSVKKYLSHIAELGAQAEGEYRILLAHRPTMFDDYAAAGFDLALTGHNHGGQIRLPLVGGLYAPDEGFFPEYDSGLYEHESGRKMYVNRGLGNSGFPQRLFNRPEIAVIEIVPEEQTN